MRIALVVQGGLDRSLRERVVPALLWLVERLAGRHDVHAFVLRHEAAPATYPLLGATVHDLGRPRDWNGARLGRLGLALVRAMRAAGSFDVVHAYRGGPPAALGVLAARVLGLPAVVTFDGGEMVGLADIGYGLQQRVTGRAMVALAARLARRRTVGTRFMHDLAAARGWSSDVIPIGVDRGRFPLRAPIAEGPPWRLLHVGAVNAVKNAEAAVRAVRVLVDRGLDVHLDVVGEDLRAGALAAEVRRLDLAARVTLHGFRPSADLPAFYARAHACVLPSRHEAASLVVLEAAATGVPTVGSRVGYVADGDGQWTLAAGFDADSLAAAVARLLGDAAERDRLAHAAHAFALAHDADWTAARFEEVYAEVQAR